MKKAIPVYVQLNARLMPMDRGALYEDPLIEALEKSKLGKVAGGGTMQQKTGEIEYCGIDVDLFDRTKGMKFLVEFLGPKSPRGSKLQVQEGEEMEETPFGVLEGVALYLNGTDLNDEVYQTNDVNDLIDELNGLLDDQGSMFSYWQGPTETALYFYGSAAKEMEKRIRPLLKKHPLCQKSRLTKIA